MEILLFITGILAGYIAGSIPTAVWVSRIFYKMDIRTQGSGNAGATNTIRVLGLKAGIPVLLFDAFKGWLAVFLAHYFISQDYAHYVIVNYQIFVATAAVLGHIFPLFAGFKGGKGVATLLGVGIALYPNQVWIVLVLFLIIFFSSGYVSLSSISASILFPVTVLLYQNPTPTTSLIILSIAVAVFIPLTHRKNIIRLIKGEESRFHFRKQ